jgi:hypothetical protein
MTEENYYEKILEVLDRYTSILASEIAKTLTKDKEIVA